MVRATCCARGALQLRTDIKVRGAARFLSETGAGNLKRARRRPRAGNGDVLARGVSAEPVPGRG